MPRKLCPLLIVALLCVSGGCASKTSTFTGKVSHKGKPITSGVIYFLGPAPAMQMGMGTIHDDGTYSATDVPVGEVRISFQAPGVPDKYADSNNSNLVFTITSSMTTLDIDIP